MAALNGHGSDRRGVDNVESWVCLQTNFAMPLHTTGNAGITPDTSLWISNYNAIHMGHKTPSFVGCDIQRHKGQTPATVE